MSLNATLARVTDRIRARSAATRGPYLDRMARAIDAGPARSHLSCGNQAHAYAAMGPDKDDLSAARAPNIGIVTAYNDMLSAHQPFEAYPALIRAAARDAGATVQVAGGVPAMCDGVTQGQPGMELSLFSRDVIALSAAIIALMRPFTWVFATRSCRGLSWQPRPLVMCRQSLCPQAR
jgi:phosphogluconate dehydratase